MNTRNIFLGICLAVCYPFAGYADTDALLFNLKDGTTKSYPLSDITKIQVGSGKVSLSLLSGVSDVSISSFNNITFGDAAGVNGIVGDGTGTKISVGPNPADSYINIIGVTGDANVRVYTIDGTLVRNVSAWTGEAIDVSGLSSGIYLICINNTTLKFRKL